MSYFFKFVFLFFLILCNQAYSQTHIIDSLKRQVANAASKEQKVQALLELCGQKYSLNAALLYHYASEVKKISQKEPNARNSILADYYIAYSMVTNNMEDSSLRMANYYLEKLKDNKSEQEAYKLFLQLKGIIFYRTNRSKETINTYYDLLNVAQQSNDTLFSLLAKRGISLAYIVNGQDGEGVKIFHSAMQLIPDRNSKKYEEIYGLLQINASISYLHLHQATGLMLYADSCEYYGNEAVVTGRRMENLFMLCQGLVVKGVIQSYKKKMGEAEKNLKDGLEVRKMIGDTVYIISDMSVLASFYANTKQGEKGVAISLIGIEMARKTKLSPALLLPLYNALAENYKAVGQYKEYAEALKLQISVKDSLNIKSSSDELKNLEIKYNLQKQENTIIQQKLNITKKNYWLYGSALFTLMAAAIFWLAFRNYRRRQIIKMSLVLAEEKRIASQSVKDAEEHERKRIAADLHDNLGVYAASLSSNLNYLQPGNTDLRTGQAMQELQNNSNAIISELNDTIWVLKKDALSLTAISDRIKIFISRIRKSYPGINIEVKEKIETDFLLPSSQAFHLYRIVQEAVNNSLRHSNSKNVTVEIIANIEWKVMIEDDGKGMNEDSKSSDGGNGLMNMKERSAEAGWAINWITGGQKGTIVEIYPTTN
jgi:two-component system, NarL family, sensor kinase